MVCRTFIGGSSERTTFGGAELSKSADDGIGIGTHPPFCAVLGGPPVDRKRRRV